MECGTNSMTVNPKKKKPVYAALSVSHKTVELAVFSPKTLSIEYASSIPLPEGLLDPELDTVRDEMVLRELIAQVLRGAKPRPAVVHLSLPGTLLRMVEMPRMEPSSLYVSLSSEAERYKAFDNTEACVDFTIVDNAHHLPPNMQQLMLGAVRSDALAVYLKILKDLKVKVHSIGLEPLNVLRGMAGTGVLDSLVQQVGADAHWGMILADPSRIRFSLWQCDKLLEFRELSMDTRNFGNAANDPVVVEDLLEEIRRTTKTLQPVLWMTDNIPPQLEEVLSGHLGCPVRTAPIGNAVNMNQPLSLCAIGAVMTSMVPFPFEMDITEGLGRSAGMPTSTASSSAGETGGGKESPPWLIPAGVASIVLGGMASAIVWMMAMSVTSQVPDLQSKVDGTRVEVSGLESRQRELKRKAELDQSLIEMLEKAKIRNHVYVALTDDLKRKTPTEVWIQTMLVNDGIALAGKALNHKAVINFAKSFDVAPYTKAVLIDSIVEGKIAGSLVFDFKISGGVNLDKSILPEPEPASEQSVESAKPGA